MTPLQVLRNPEVALKLLHIGQLITSRREIRPLVRSVVKAAGQLIRADRCSLWVLDRRSQEVYTMAGAGLDHEIRMPVNEGLVGEAMSNHVTLNIPNAYNHPTFNSRWDQKTGYHTGSVLCQPMTRQGQVIACFQAINSQRPGGIFLPEDEEISRIIADFTAIAVENALLIEDLRRLFETTIVAFAKAVDARDPTTGDHTRMVTALSVAIARELGLDLAEVERLRVAAILHDCGKIGVPDNILMHPDRLDSVDMEIMRGHVVTTRRILEGIDWPRGFEPVVDIAAAHHEKLDGSGYPDGLSGEFISMPARILAVADIFHALTQKRPYKPAQDPVTALDTCRDLTTSPRYLDLQAVTALSRVLEGCHYQVESLVHHAGW